MKRSAFLVLFGALLTTALWYSSDKPWSQKGSHSSSFLEESKVALYGSSPSLGTVSASTAVDKDSPEVAEISRPKAPKTTALRGSPSSQNAFRKRPWDVDFFSKLANAKAGQSIEFDLVKGAIAVGTIRQSRSKDNQLVYVSGDLIKPEPGRFFFQKQSVLGVAGDYVGVVEFRSSQTAYRIEPLGPEGAPELTERPLASVLCAQIPRPGTIDTNGIEKLPALKLGNFSDLPIPPYQQGIIVLESLHGALPVIYLDFAGGYTPAWNGVSYARPDVSNAQILEVWSRVAEDFLPFNINVTTDLQIYQNASEGSRQRVIITPTQVAGPESGGAAYIGSFNWTGETPCWVFVVSGKYCAEACSHEAGHALGLNHDGQLINGINTVYYYGQGSGETGWAPIMGVSYVENVSQWSDGDYNSSNNHNDQLDMITTLNNGVAYRPDDTGDSLATSRYLELYTDYTARAEGIIERTADTDAFQFTTEGGMVSLRADPASAGPNLAMQVSLYDASDSMLAASNPQETLWASLTTNVPPGTYTFRVTGAGRHDPSSNGFSSYASLGYYSITGSVAKARLPDRFEVQEHAANGAVVGKVPRRSGNADPVAFTIVAGNSGNTFAIDSSGMLTVSNNTLLDYNFLAGRNQLEVQFEVFVNITDLQDSSLSETNRRVVVAVLPIPPTISAQPQDVTAPAGTTVSLSVYADSTALPQFQWFFNGAPLPGANNSTLSLTNVQSANAGQYFAVVMSWFSANTSRVATVSVSSAAPQIVLQPKSKGAFPGLWANLECLAIGSEPFNYQWQLNGVDIPGATQSGFNLTNFLPEYAGTYSTVVSNSVGQTRSDEALLALVPVAAWGSNSSGQTELPVDLTNAVQVSAGVSHNVALKRDGTVFAWGDPTLCQLPIGLSNIIAVAAGAAHSLVLRSNGTLSRWGNDSFGQLDIPLNTISIVSIAAGANHNLALKANGQVVAWGSGAYGQTRLPAGLTNIVGISAGSNHSLALRADGVVIAWGDNSFGQTNTPGNLTNVVAIAAGGNHSLALKMDGTVAAWGNNANGQVAVPTLLSNVVSISGGAFNSMALKADGTLVGWGAGDAATESLFPNFGQSSPPHSVTNVTQVSCGATHTLAMAGDGAPFIIAPPVSRFYGAGSAVIFRACATGSFPLSYQWQFMGTNVPGATNQLLILEDVSSLAAGSYSVVVSNAFGTVTSIPAQLSVKESPFVIEQPQDQNIWVGGSVTMQVAAGGLLPLSYQWWFKGALIAGATNSVFSFDNVSFEQQGEYSVVISNRTASVSSRKASLSVSQVAAWGVGSGSQDNIYNYGQTVVPNGLTGVVQIAAGTFHSLALKQDGTVVAWGAETGIMQQGGNVSYGQCSVPSGLSHVVEIAAGQYHSLALTDQGRVIAWGAGATNLNRVPHLGQSAVPPGLNGVIAIAAGDYFSVALKQDSRVVVWGGLPGVTSLTNVPGTAVNCVRIAAHGSSILALTSRGSVVQWGSGSMFMNPTAVEIAAGANFSMALQANGTISGWGNILPPPGLTNVVEIAAGYNHALAVRANGSVVTWGQTNAYHLGAIPKGLSNVIDIAGGQYHSLAVVGNGSLSVRAQPADQLAFVGAQTAFTVGASGAQPLKYQWFFNGAKLNRATNAWLSLSGLQMANAGEYQVVVTNVLGAATSRVARLSVMLPIGPAVNAPGLSWFGGGDAFWFGETNVSRDHFQGGQSGAIGDSQKSFTTVSVSGPGSLSFWWKVSSEAWFDYLNFYIDDVKQTGISGEVDWEQQTFKISSGAHTLKWSYEKDSDSSAGMDTGWLDEVAFAPYPPVITVQPASQIIQAGSPLALNVTATGAGPLSYQWIKDGTNLPNVSSSLWIQNSTRQNSGTYAVLVSSPAASALSSNAFVGVISPQRLKDPIWMSDGTFRIVSEDEQGVRLTQSQLSSFQAQVSTNLLDWSTLEFPLWFINGDPVLVDHDATNYQQRFYRIVERLPAGQ